MSNINKIHIAICDPYLETKGGGEKCAIATAEALTDFSNVKVSLLIYDDPKKIDKSALEKYFKADLSNVEILWVQQDKNLLERYERYEKHLPRMIKDFCLAYIEYKAFREHDIDVFINNFYKSNVFNPAKLGIYFCMFPQKLAPPTPAPTSIPQRAYRRLLTMKKKKLQMESEPSKMLGTYQKIISISSFTKEWVDKYWDRESDIVFPICEDMHKPGIKKEKIILNVGRFFSPGGDKHHKKQDVLLDAFLSMKDLIDDGWELHFAGGIARDTEAMEYALALVMKARNFPVFFHFDTPFEELQKLYNQATVYWHATGFGVNESEHPDQQEHFGITSVEAMSAGVIPVVLNAAGQRDTVVHGSNGYLWESIDDLKKYTREVLNAKPTDFNIMKKTAIEYSKQFDKAAYQANIKHVIVKDSAQYGINLK